MKFISAFVILSLASIVSGWSCSDAPPCGTVMAYYNGIPAYSNGPADQCSGASCANQQTYGLGWQCVELAQRYYSQKFGTPHPWSGVNTAWDMCSSWTWPAGVSSTGNPGPGDLIVLSAYTHVAVITGVSGTTVNVIEQNSSPTGTDSYQTYQAKCFLTHGGSSAWNPCAGWGSGRYCGHDGLGGNPNALYTCSNGQLIATTQCQVCETMPYYANDQCTSGSCAGKADGFYCGSDGIGGDPNANYLCEAGTVSSVTYCEYGCNKNPPGTPDSCNWIGGYGYGQSENQTGLAYSPDGSSKGKQLNSTELAELTGSAHASSSMRIMSSPINLIAALFVCFSIVKVIIY